MWWDGCLRVRYGDVFLGRGEEQERETEGGESGHEGEGKGG